MDLLRVINGIIDMEVVERTGKGFAVVKQHWEGSADTGLVAQRSGL